MSRNVIYLTGAGKCGTHLAAKYVASNCTDTYLHPIEFKDWKDDLLDDLNRVPPEQNYLFHALGTEIRRFKALVPDGQTLLMLRHPAQNYLAWQHGLHNRIMGGGYFNIKSLDRSVLHYGLGRIVTAFLRARDADHVWRLEDFTRSPQARRDAIRSLPLAVATRSPDDEVIDLTVGKSNYLASDTISAVTATEYADPLARFEMDALLEHDDHFCAYYPDWKSTVNVSDAPAAEVLKNRFMMVLSARPGLKKRRLRNARRRGVVPLMGYLVRHLPKDLLRYPQGYWSDEFVQEIEQLEGSLVNYSRHLGQVAQTPLETS